MSESFTWISATRLDRPNQGVGKISQVSDAMIDMAYYFLITALGRSLIGKSCPSILSAVLPAVRGKISQLLD